MIYLQLFWEFLQIGIFAVGGGMATIPFLQHLSESTGWFPPSLITDMVAISESTPGPIGINMATYVGCAIAGIPGGIIATLGEVLPSVVIISVVSMYLNKFRDNKLVGYAFYGLRPAVTGLIAAAGVSVAKVAMLRLELFQQTGSLPDLVDLKKLVFFVLVFAAIKTFKLHPLHRLRGGGRDCAVVLEQALTANNGISKAASPVQGGGGFWCMRQRLVRLSGIKGRGYLHNKGNDG